MEGGVLGGSQEDRLFQCTECGGETVVFLEQGEGWRKLGDSMCSIKTSLPLASIMFTSKVPSSNTYRLQHISPCSRITVFSLIS